MAAAADANDVVTLKPRWRTLKWLNSAGCFCLSDKIVGSFLKTVSLHLSCDKVIGVAVVPMAFNYLSQIN